MITICDDHTAQMSAARENSAAMALELERACEVAEVVDFSPFAALPLHEAPRPDQRQLAAAAQIDGAFRRHGVLLLSKLPLREQQLSATFDCARRLFAQPLQHKLQRLPRLRASANWGYIPGGMETLNRERSADLKEAFNFDNPALCAHTFDGCPRQFETQCAQLFGELSRIARRFAVACALALGLPPHHLSDMLRRLDQATLRLLHYPPCEFEDRRSTGELRGAPIRVGEHVDYGLFTLLFCDGRGLQVSAARSGTCAQHGRQPWLDVPLPAGGCAIVTPGALLARVSNDRWRGTLHRVVVLDAHMARRSRYSLAFFADPDRSCVIEPHAALLARGERARYARTTAGEYEAARLRDALTAADGDSDDDVVRAR